MMKRVEHKERQDLSFCAVEELKGAEWVKCTKVFLICWTVSRKGKIMIKELYEEVRDCV